MNRNWGLPTKPDQAAFRTARSERPAATLMISAVYGIIGAAIAAISFNEARTLLENLFHGRSLVMSVVAAGFGCWIYIWLARARFAAHFTGTSDAFSDLLRFYAKAALVLLVVLLAGRFAGPVAGDLVSVLLLCASGGAAAAAAFQTVIAFVPTYQNEEPR